MAHYYLFLFTLLITFSFCFGINYSPGLPLYRVANLASQYPGGKKFDKSIGIPFAKKAMADANRFIWDKLFEQHTAADRKPMDSVNLYIVQFKGGGISWGNNNTNISSRHLELFQGNSKFTLKWEFTYLVYHELTHLFGWDGEGKCPDGLIEGIAAYATLKAKFFPPFLPKPGTGNKWDQGYDVTARFLEYCDRLVPGFVAKLNKMMRKTFDIKFFQNLTGKPVDQLWKEYKAKHGHKV